MPFVFDQTQVAWPDDGSDLPPPRADQFVYLPAPAIGGARAPVRFTVPPADDPPAPIEPSPPRRGILQRLLGRPSFQQVQRQRRRLAEHRLFATVIPALLEIGVQRAYCRYDGGNDEGFAWLDSVELRDGARLDVDRLIARWSDDRLAEELYAARLRKPAVEIPEPRRCKRFVIDWLCEEWAALLLGDRFGTGEYMLYGAFTVDLPTCTITDDPAAAPVVENITIAK